MPDGAPSLITVVETSAYLAMAAGLLDNAERMAIVDLIAADPRAGDLIRETGGLRKVRVPLEGRGKRGGGRLITYFHDEDMPVFLIAFYAKNAQTDLDARQRRRPRRSPTPSARNTGARAMNKTDFDGLVAGLEDALAYAKGHPNPGTRKIAVEVDRTFVAAARLKAGLTQQEFARVTGASLGTVRKWERGERSPSGAARMLVRILARDPALVIAEAGLADGARKRRGSEAG